MIGGGNVNRKDEKYYKMKKKVLLVGSLHAMHNTRAE